MSPCSRRRALTFVLLGTCAAARAGVVEIVPAMNVPLAPTPVVAQLRADLMTLGAPMTLALPPRHSRPRRLFPRPRWPLQRRRLSRRDARRSRPTRYSA